MNKSWQAYAHHILVHNYLGDIDALNVASVIHRHLPPLIDCVQALLAADVSSDS